MNFDFSEDLHLLREQARKFLCDRCTPKVVRTVFESGQTHDAGLWREIAQMGWLGAAIPEEFGGAGLGHEGLCVLAEEIGRALAPVPFSSVAYLAAEALMLHGQPEAEAGRAAATGKG